MPLWLEHLLEDPGLGLELVAGRRGLRQRGPIRWVHISEIPDPTPWLEGGEVLLTTGMGVLDSAEGQRKLIAGLDGRGCPAVGFGVGICTDEVPDAMREEAEARDLPLFTVPYAVPFIAVTKRISRQIFDEHYATLRAAVDLHRQVLGTVLAGSGLEGVLRTLSRAMPGAGWYVFDYYGQLIGHRAPNEGDPEEPGQLWSAIHAAFAESDHIEEDRGAGVVVGNAVRLGDEVEAYLVVQSDAPLHEHEVLLLEQGLAGVSLELARGQSTRETRRARVEDLVEEALAGRLSQEVIADRLTRLGIDLAGGYVVLCVTLATSERALRGRAVCAVVEDALTPLCAPVVGRRDGAVLGIVPAASGPVADRVAGAVHGRGWSAAIGRSRVKHDAGGLANALREAEAAARGGTGGVRDIADLGLAGMLVGLDDALGAEAFVQQVIGPVLAHDAAEGTGLADTLRAYQRHGCRPGPAADELCIHRHTLSYRLDRVRSLTGRDPRDGEHLLAFALALELEGRSGGEQPERR